MKNMKHYAFTALLAGVMIAPIAANAEDMADKAAGANASVAITSQTFKSLDSDRSGSLSEAEFSKFSEASIDFKQADSNGDGTLTLSEAQMIKAAPSAQ